MRVFFYAPKLTTICFKMEIVKGQFLVSTDKSKLQIDVVHDYLANHSYWAKGIPVEIVERSIANSIVFGVYAKENEILKQVGFCRITSDLATFAYLADVFILDEYRGHGLSKFLMEAVTSRFTRITSLGTCYARRSRTVHTIWFCTFRKARKFYGNPNSKSVWLITRFCGI